jgi:hypothetical protein
MKSTHRIAASALTALLTVGSFPADAGILFDNGQPVAAMYQSRTANDPDQRLYEDFSLASASTITGINWEQHDRPDTTYGFTTLRIYEGLPETSTLIYSADLIGTRASNGSGMIFDQFVGYDYSLSGLQVTLAPGTYFFALIDSASNRTGWDDTDGSASTIPGYRIVNGNFPAPGVNYGRNLAFQIIGVAAVPEPDPSTLMLVGVAGLGFLVSRRGSANRNRL